MWGRVLGIGFQGVRLGAAVVMIVVVVVVLAWCVGACPRCRVSGGSAQCSDGGGDGVLYGSVSSVLRLGSGGIGSVQWWWWWCGGVRGRVLGVGVRGIRLDQQRHRVEEEGARVDT